MGHNTYIISSFNISESRYKERTADTVICTDIFLSTMYSGQPKITFADVNICTQGDSSDRFHTVSLLSFT